MEIGLPVFLSWRSSRSDERKHAFGGKSEFMLTLYVTQKRFRRFIRSLGFNLLQGGLLIDKRPEFLS